MSHAYLQNENRLRPVPPTLDRTGADALIDELETSFVRIEPEVEAFLPEEARFTRLRARVDTLFELARSSRA